MKDDIYLILLGLAVIGLLALLGTVVFTWSAYLLQLILGG